MNKALIVRLNLLFFIGLSLILGCGASESSGGSAASGGSGGSGGDGGAGGSTSTSGCGQGPGGSGGACGAACSADGEACDDGDPCTANDTCAAGDCVGVLTCEDAACAPLCKLPEATSEWSGSYVCNQGLTNLTLTITRKGSADLTAVFAFSEHPDNPGVPSGSFNMVGTFDPNGDVVELNATDWIRKPPGFETVDLEGVLDPTQIHIDGEVLAIGCSSFSVSKQ
jgi:hypothetical protein